MKSAMQVTVDYMPSLADVTKVEDFWMQGYGFVNAKAAVDRYFADRNAHFLQNPKRAGRRIWGKEREVAAS